MNEEIKNKLTERFNSAYGEEVKIGLRDALRKVYLDGAEHGYQYALQHPHWIPVEEELPPASCGVISDPVLVFIGNNKGWCGYIREGFYNHAAKEWNYMNRGRTHKVTHWMPIVPPRKEDKK